MNRFEESSQSSNLHPEGEFTGTINEVKGQGIRETPYGDRHKLTIQIESDSLDEGLPFAVTQWFTVSPHELSNLSKFRSGVLGRPPEPGDIDVSDVEAELVGRRVGYRVVHRVVHTTTYANIETVWQISPDTESVTSNPVTDIPY
jgi:hypothetical protein